MNAESIVTLVSAIVGIFVTALASYGAFRKIKAEADSVTAASRDKSVAATAEISERLNRIATTMTEDMRNQVASLEERLTKSNERSEKMQEEMDARSSELDAMRSLFMECHNINNSLLAGIISSIDAIEFYIRKRNSIIDASQVVCVACIEADKALLDRLAEIKGGYMEKHEEIKQVSAEVKSKLKSRFKKELKND